MADTEPLARLSSFVEALPAPLTEEWAWATLGPSALIDHVEVTHHTREAEALTRLAARAEVLAGELGGQHAAVLEVLARLGELRGDLLAHDELEEQRAFPMIRHAERVRWQVGSDAALVALIAQLRAEHRATSAALDEVVRLAEGIGAAPGSAMATLADDLRAFGEELRLHLHKEDDVLFPEVERHLARCRP